GVEIRIAPRPGISGHVFNPDASPLEGATVVLFKQVFQEGRKQYNQHLRGETKTDRNGEYKLTNLQPGRYLVRASSPEPDKHSSNTSLRTFQHRSIYYPSAPGQESATAIELHPGTMRTGVDILLDLSHQPRMVQVSGTLTGLDPNTPYADIELVPVDDIEHWGIGTTTKAPDHAFEMLVPAGEYLAILNFGTDENPSTASLNLNLNKSRPNLVIPVHRKAKITGHISMLPPSQGLKLQGVLAQLRNSSTEGNEFGSNSDVDGRLSFAKAVRWGRYALEINLNSLPKGCFVHQVRLDGQEIDPDEIEIQGDGHLEIILSKGSATIHALVVDNEGIPMVESNLTLIPQGRRALPDARLSGMEGRVEFQGLQPGTYRLYAWDHLDLDVREDPDLLKKYSSQSVQITVGPGETKLGQVVSIRAPEMNRH
ncbi:MAG: carboxypeptidase-like regulatory domain-containing protein, partial [Acidobacteria bacterium]|nr:carboxypeptidase-like regulatory domain-containing protein [Acidobacteriota bacterium]